jgi:hypothetical protein
VLLCFFLRLQGDSRQRKKIIRITLVNVSNYIDYREILKTIKVKKKGED